MFLFAGRAGFNVQVFGAAMLLTLPMLVSLGTTANAASFDCDSKELKPDEKAICDTRSLNDADVKMVTTFDLLSGLMAMGSRGTLQDEQAAWLKKRQDCGADLACLKASYESRLQQLDETYKHLNRPL
ncbi:hypothetical protein CPY51_00310 [Rhizobium tubonense]|uniref:Lysozyme inhibitor LprI N-terminal domain-containing protein n=2 Tax=Rhizobium tubonense TaxID=484088 RepID=A0A2W4CVK1_9HYPH|nr:hypothetical protein CPY51_00310 [Rhizobium tubonense]